MKTLLSTEAISARIRELGEKLTRDYQGKPLTCITVLNGAIFFAADLIREIRLPLQMDSLAAASYSGEHSTGKLTFRSRLKLPVRGRHVLLIDDILDTGLTLKQVSGYLQEQGAADVRTCVLLDKKAPRDRGGLEQADYTGFTVENLYIVGYGLDRDEEFRNLPEIMAYDDPA